MWNTVWFYYEFKSLMEILNSIRGVFEYSTIDLSMFAVLFVFVFITVFYIVPLAKIFQDYALKQREKKSKKTLLNKIRLQKQIEDEIDIELKEDERRQIEERKKALEL